MKDKEINKSLSKFIGQPAAVVVGDLHQFGNLHTQNGIFGVGNVGFQSDSVKEIVEIEVPPEVNLIRVAIHLKTS